MTEASASSAEVWPFRFFPQPLVLVVALLIVSLPVIAVAAEPAAAPFGETPAQHQSMMKWWRQAKFGLFIHWGIYAVPARGEWYMTKGHVPRDTYAKYAKQFDPTKFDADRWVKLAKAAGMRYLVITSKHHDGFCMFNTAATKYNVVDATAWGKDPLKALSAACKKYGVHFGVYYSIMDWHSPDQAAAKPDPNHPSYNPTHFKDGKKQAYIAYMEAQLKELITQYHPEVIWFDGGWMHGWTTDDGKKIVAFIRKLDRKVIINNRIGYGLGDYGTPERRIPGIGKASGDWESCDTIANGPWGYAAHVRGYKSDKQLIQRLATIASRGGNYLLNVGPKPDGTIPAPEVKRLKAMGDWLKVNGDSIYGTTGSDLSAKVKWGVVTKRVEQNKTTLYLHIFHWPADGKLTIPAALGKVARVYLLASPGKDLPYQAAGKLIITLPGKVVDPVDTVVAVELTHPASAE